MHYLKRLSKKNSENAVSPVVGVMLMLVVTIIIAAVVSAFSGGLIGQGTPKAPTLTMNVKVVNTGISATSGFFATVTGISNPVQTKNEELITSWQTTNRVTGAAITGGNTTIYVNGTLTAPLGYGPGVLDGVYGDSFGNYTLVSGTGMSAIPTSTYGQSTQYVYGSGSAVIDNMGEVLGTNWQYPQAG